MKKRYIWLVMILVLGVILVTKSRTNNALEKSDYMVATHYFANEWPLNFWNAEWDTLDQDLQQIKQDGFNTVIILVPWREFQPEMTPIMYNENAFLRLKEFLTVAEEYGLKVQIRLGYLNDFGGEINSTGRFYDIVGDKTVRQAWMEFADNIYEICCQYSSFDGGFITWEEFWHNYALVDYVGGTPDALIFSEKSGFPQYLAKKYTIQEFNEIFSTKFTSFDEVGVPAREDSYAEEWFYFIDEFTMELLVDTKMHFPELFMEVRTDDDPIGTRTGKTRVSHMRTWPCADCEFTTIMYKPTQGISDSSVQISAKEALQYMESWIDNIYQNNAQKKIYIDQFLFVDNTPGHTGGHLVKDDELTTYLADCIDILQEYTNGYGVWVYKDYCNNMLYNPQFALGLQGWNSTGEIKESEKDGSKNVILSAGAELMQVIPEWHKTAMLEGVPYYFEMDYEVKETGNITITVGTQERVIEVDEAGCLNLEFANENDMLVKISSDTEIAIDNIKLYNFVQSQELYSVDNEELSAIEAIRELNESLEKVIASKDN